MARNTSRTTIDHAEIRRWAEERGGTASEVAATESGAGGGAAGRRAHRRPEGDRPDGEA